MPGNSAQPPAAVSLAVNAERMVLLGWSRAILLQLAHPLVAAGVSDHTSVRGGRLAAATRLHHTIKAMRALAFGDEHAHASAIEGIKAIHRRVNGHLRAPVGHFPAGTPYSAEDPALLLWVHATLLDSTLRVYERVVSPLTGEARDAYCAEASRVAVELGARYEEIPRTWAALQDYLAAMYACGTLAVSADARELASAVLAPPFSGILAPLTWPNRLVTLGLLPDSIRAQYGFPWSDRRERALRRTLTVLRQLRRVLPGAVAHWPDARRARAG